MFQISVMGNGCVAVANGKRMIFPSFIAAVRWVEAVKYGFQPAECIFDGGCCGYPIDDCANCPVYPNSDDPYWNKTICEVE